MSPRLLTDAEVAARRAQAMEELARAKADLSAAEARIRYWEPKLKPQPPGMALAELSPGRIDYLPTASSSPPAS